MTRLNRNALMILAPMALASGSAGASSREITIGSATYSIVVRHLDPHPGSPKTARATLARIGEAAMEVCGGSSFSLREVKASIRASACWRDSMADALARIGDPMLADAYDQGRHHQLTARRE